MQADASTAAAPRYYYLDALRAFAMLLGIGLHGSLSFIEAPAWPAQDINQNTALFSFLMDAVHGFRMQLFFLISGFFTAMMWRRRGLGGLIKHRAIRIAAPMGVALVIMCPLIWIIAAIGAEGNKLPTILVAVKAGDAAEVEKQIDAGANVEIRDEFGMPALSWAAIEGHSSVAEMLLDAGAEVDAEDYEGSTALHFAAFFGRHEVVKMLLDHGADINDRNRWGDSPMDSAYTDLETLKWVAGVIGTEVDEEKVGAGRAETVEVLKKRKAELGAQKIEGNPWEGIVWIYSVAAFAPVFHHLWFLHYLLWLIGGFVLLALIFGRRRIPLPAWLVRSPWCLAWVVPVAFGLQLTMEDQFGPATASGIIPWPPILFYYAIYFYFGALCYQRGDWIQKTGRLWPFWLLIALPLLFLGRATDQQWIASLCATVYSWAMIFGMIGLFRKFLAAPNPRMRYFSDASYWLYIAHLPLMMVLQILARDIPLPGELKFLLICAVTMVILIPIYEYFVRYSFVGTMLNGKRERELVRFRN